MNGAPQQWIVSFREGVSLSSRAAGEVRVHGPTGASVLKQFPAPLLSVFEKLRSPGERFDRLVELAAQTRTADALARLIFYLQLLARRGFVNLSVGKAGEPLAVLEPTADSFRWPRGDAADQHYLLSRFAYLHRVDNLAVLESPLSASRLVIHDERVWQLAAALTSPQSVLSLQKRIPELPPENCRALLELLQGTSLVSAVDEKGQPAERKCPELESWEFHDLLFHARSRSGRHDAPLGATFRLAGRTEPPPAIATRRWSGVVELPPPNLEAARTEDLPLAEVLERRESIRDYGERAISRGQLGEFLFRVARIRRREETEFETPAGPLRMDFTSRPYPSGGSLYELEVYPLVQHAEGLDPGLYYYDALEHRLRVVTGWTGEVQRLMEEAGFAAGIPRETLQVLLVLAARFGRVAWKYSSIAYSLILKHVGVLYQTMYLAATAMGLAPCALGSGNSDLFARAAGLDYYRETSVGEFLLGSKGEL